MLTRQWQHRAGVRSVPIAHRGNNGAIETVVAKLRPQIPYFVGHGCRGAIMMRRAIVLVLSCAALSGCGAIPSMPSFSLPSVNMPSFGGGGASGTPVHLTSVPAGAEASFGKDYRITLESL